MTERTVTVGGYGNFPATTIVGTYSASECKSSAAAYVRVARFWLAHSGPDANYPADLYYTLLRQVFADYEAHACPPYVLGLALRGAMSASQRKALVANLPAAMSESARNALKSS